MKQWLIGPILCAFISFSVSAQEESLHFQSDNSLGIIFADGNSNFETWKMNSDSSYRNKHNLYSLLASYLYSESDGVRSGENWTIKPAYTRILNPKWSASLAQSIMSNRYKGIQRRYDSDLGVNYNLYSTKTVQVMFSFGHVYSVEEQKGAGNQTLKTQKGRLSNSSSYQFNQQDKFKLSINFERDYSDSSNWELKITPELIFKLSTLLSYKGSVEYEYDNAPVLGNGKKDVLMSHALIATF